VIDNSQGIGREVPLAPMHACRDLEREHPFYAILNMPVCVCRERRGATQAKQEQVWESGMSR